MKPAELQRQFFEMLMESQYWSPAALIDYQRSQLAQLLRHARANVPFYAHRLNRVFTASGDIDWDRWGEIPIVKRADLIEHREAMLARQLPPGHGPVARIRSSGSTGHPVEAVVTRISKISSDATAWRAGAWRQLDYGRTLCIRNGYEPEIVPPSGRALGPWGPPWDAAASKGHSVRMTRDWSAADQLDLIVSSGASYVAIGGTKSGSILAYEAERRGIAPPLIAMLVNGEEVTAADRDLCRRVFGAEIFDLYSSKEGGHMAHPCPTGSGYHVNAERILIEILDDAGLPVAAGQSGRVVVTPFYSTAQPLIRYDHGDLATLGAPCACGRCLPLLRSIDGRTGTMFVHPDGRRRARGFPMSYLQVLDARMWQLAQVGARDYEIRYVPNDPARIGDEAATAAAFRQHFFEDARVAFRRLDAVPLTASGKYMEYVNEVDKPTLRATLT